MTARTILSFTCEETKETHYLFFFNDENKYSIASRKLVVCEDKELVVGSMLKVKDSGKIFIGCLINIGEKEQLENILKVQEKVFKTPVPKQKSKLVTKTKGQKRSMCTTNFDTDDSGEDQPKACNNPKRVKILASEESASSESDYEYSLKEERRKEQKLLQKSRDLSIVKMPITKSSTDPLATKVKSLEKTVRELEEKVQELQNRVMQPASPIEHSTSQVMSACSPSQVEPCKSGVEKKEVKEIFHNGINLMNISAPSKQPGKCALNLLNCLFSNNELEGGILIKTRRSVKPALDAERVAKLFDVLNANYGLEKVKCRAQIIEACNQKCRDQGRKSKVAKLYQQLNAINASDS